MFDAKKETQKIVEFIRDYYKKNNLGGAVLGISGGKDSAVVVALLVEALGKENVLAVGMPCLSIESDLEDAKLVADTFGVKMMTVDLNKTYFDLETEIQKSLNKE